MKSIALPSTFGLLLCLHATPAQAVPETWVAGNGGGVACSRTAPCASFQVAHNATDPGGIIKCVDAGSFSIATITKSITIDCTGTNGGSVNALSNAIAVDGVDVVVTLRGLSIDGLGTGTAGVRFVNGSALHIQNCSISGSTQAGILFARSAAGTAKLHVSDSVLSNNGVGILIEASGSGSVRGMLTRVQVENNSLQGITASGLGGNGSIVVQVRDSVVASNTGHGIFASTPGGPTVFTAFIVDRSSSLLNGGDGIRAQGARAVVHIGNSTVIGNGGGLIVDSGGQILSYQNNQASGNGVDGAPTGVLTVK
jgi:hypothetical protein